MDKSSSTGQLLFHLLSILKLKCNSCSECSSAGRIAARARGRYGGLPKIK